MAETFRFVCSKPARILYSSICVKSSPRLDDGQQGEARYGGTFGLEKVDFDAMVPIMVNAIKSETGGFTSPVDYYLACMSGKTAGERAIATAEFKCQNPSLSEDTRFKIKEKAQQRAELYKPFAGILIANSKFPIELARLENGKVIDIPDEEHARATAGKDLFFPGAWAVPSIAVKGFRRKKLDDKDGCTAFLQNCLFIKKDAKLGSSGPSNNDVFGSFAAGYSDFDPTGGAPTADDVQAAF